MNLRSCICLLFVFLDVVPLLNCNSKKNYCVIFNAHNVTTNVYTDFHSIIELNDSEITITKEPEFASEQYVDEATQKAYEIDYWYYLEDNKEMKVTFPITVVKEECTSYFQGNHYSFIIFAHWIEANVN